MKAILGLFKLLVVFVFIFIISNHCYGQGLFIEYRWDRSPYFLPIFIDGKLKGLTNQQIEIELENGEHLVTIQVGERFYEFYIKQSDGKYTIEDKYYIEKTTITPTDRNVVHVYLREYDWVDPYWESAVNSPSIQPSTYVNKTVDTLVSNKTTNYLQINNNNSKHDHLDSLVVYCKNGKYGYKDNKGNIAIKAKYQYAEPFINKLNCAIVKKGEKFGIINMANEFIIKPQYSDLKYIHLDHFLAEKRDLRFYYGYGIININHDRIIGFGKSKINNSSKYYICHSGDDIGVYDLSGCCLRLYKENQVEYLDLDNDVAVISTNGKYWFDNISTQFDEENRIFYDDVKKLSNNTYLTTQIKNVGHDKRFYGLVGIDGKQIITPVFPYFDVEEWECGNYQYITLEHGWSPSGDDRHSDIYVLRYDNEIDEAEILSSHQFADKYNSLLRSPYTTPAQSILGLIPLNSPEFPYEEKEYEVDSGGNTYVHHMFRYLEMGNYKFRALTHVIDEQKHLFISDKSKAVILKDIAYSQFANFADISGADIQINGISVLSNGDILLTAKANIVTGYDTYMRDPVYINIQGQLVAIDNGGTYRNYHRDDVTVVFVLDGKTFDLKHSRIMPHEYDNIYVSEYNGFFAYKSDYYGNFTITTENPILKFTNSCREDWSFAPSGGEGINCMVENSEYIYMGGYTKNKGYVGYKNPYICKLDLKSGVIVNSRSYKMKNCEINSFAGDCAIPSGNYYDISLLNNFNTGYIKLVDVTYNKMTFTGLVYNDKYWIIPPVLHGQGVKEHAGWSIHPPVVVEYDDNLKKVHSKTTKYGESVNVDMQINLDTKL